MHDQRIKTVARKKKEYHILQAFIDGNKPIINGRPRITVVDNNFNFYKLISIKTSE